MKAFFLVALMVLSGCASLDEDLRKLNWGAANRQHQANQQANQTKKLDRACYDTCLENYSLGLCESKCSY